MEVEARRRFIKPMNSREKIQIWVCQHCLPNPVFVSREDLETHETVHHVFNSVVRNSDENVTVFGYDAEEFKEREVPTKEETMITIDGECSERLEEFERVVDELNKTVHQKTQENEQLEKLTGEMTFDAKLKDASLDELREKVHELNIALKCKPGAQAPKQVENCVLMQFEEKEVALCDTVIEKNEQNIKSLHKQLNNKLSNNHHIQYLLRENQGYTEEVINVFSLSVYCFFM